MPSRRARRLPISQTIHQSGRLSPTGGMAGPHPLHPTFAVGKGALLLGKGGGREHHVGQLGGLVGKDVLHHEKLQVRQRLLRVRQIRLAE